MQHEHGFDFLSFPAASGRPDALVIILHGHNNHPDMFRALAPRLQRTYPDADVLIIKAPVPVNATAQGKISKGVPHVDDLYTWHKLEKRARPHVNLAIAHLFNRIGVIGKLNHFIDRQLEKRGLRDENLAIFGFSMGGAIAVQAAARRKSKCAAVVCHSGLVLPRLKARSKPDTLLLMGDEDAFFYTRRMTIPALPGKKGRLKSMFTKAASRIGFHLDDSVARLEKAGIPTKTEIIPELGHTITPKSFTKSVNFIAKRLRK